MGRVMVLPNSLDAYKNAFHSQIHASYGVASYKDSGVKSPAYRWLLTPESCKIRKEHIIDRCFRGNAILVL